MKEQEDDAGWMYMCLGEYSNTWLGFMGVIRDCQCFSELRNKPGDSMVPLAYRFPFNRALNPDDRANADSFTYGRPTSQLSYVDEYMYSIF